MNNKMYSIKIRSILQHNQFSNNIVVKNDPSIKITRNHSRIRKNTRYYTIANKANITFSFNI